MLRKIALLSMLLLGACETSPPPLPSIVSIEPEEVVSGEESTIAVKLDGPPPVRVDYGEKSATLMLPLTLQIGDQEVRIEGIEADGALQATVPASLPEGTPDVRLKLSDGHETVREKGLKVLPAPPAFGKDGEPAGDAPAGITQLRIDPIADQVRNEPFLVTLRVEGSEAALFDGRVQLTTNKGRIRPNLSGAFSRGVRKQEVTIDLPGGNVVLTIRLGKHLLAKSNVFRVANRE